MPQLSPSETFFCQGRPDGLEGGPNWGRSAGGGTEAGGAAAAAVECATPHPLFGGTMRTTKWFSYQNGPKTIHRFGLACSTIQLRGGGFERRGAHDGGAVGEQGTTTSGRRSNVFAAGLSQATPRLVAGSKLRLVGWIRVGCRDARVCELIGLGLPGGRSDRDASIFLSRTFAAKKGR